MQAHPEELFRAGRIDEALTALQAMIRQSPGDAKLRIFLFQLLCVNGAWERARNQLDVVAELSVEAQLMAAIFKPLITLEAFRAQVFAGQRSPLFFGEPEPFMAKFVQALSLPPESAAKLRAGALAEAPARAGRINGKPFSWIMDADGRLGPLLEVAIDRKYYWLPFHHLRSLTAAPPQDLRDLIWLPAEFEFINGGRQTGFIYARYAGSETSTDAGVRLSRVTRWTEGAGGENFGLGQRTFALDEEDFPLLELRQLEFEEEDGSAGE